MRILRFALRWCAPPLLALAGFAVSYAAFYPGLASSRLSDGTAASFDETANKISKGNLLEKASPLERVAWLLEVCKQPKSLSRDHALFETIQQLQPGDFVAAVADVPELSKWFSSLDAKLRVEVIEAVIERWMDVDPEGLMRWLPIARRIVDSGTFNLPQMGSDDLGAIYGVLARRNTAWAFDQTKDLGPKMRPEMAVKAIIRSAVESGTPQAETWLTSFKEGPLYLAALTSYVETLAATDPERAFNKLLAEAPKNEGLPARIVEIAAQRMPAAATALLDRMRESDRKRAMLTLPGMLGVNTSFDVFGWLDAEIAKDPGLINPDGDPNPAYLVAGATMRDAPKAMEWIQKFPELSREAMAATVFGFWSSSDPNALLEWLIANPQHRDSPTPLAMERMAENNPELFAKWMSSLPAGTSRQQAQFSAADRLMDAGRLDDAVKTFPKEGTNKQLVVAAQQFGFRAATIDVDRAARWLDTLQSVPLQQSATRGVVERWLFESPKAAAAWAESLSPGTLRDSAAGAIAISIAERDFEGASAWLSEVNEEHLRDKFISELYNKRHSQNPAQAVTWLRSLPRVSDTVRNRLLDLRP